MKKLFLILFMAAVSCESVWAQKGMMAVGANVAMNVTLSSSGNGIGGGAKFQYNISNFFRVEPSFTYYATGSSREASINMAGLVNIHAFFSSPRSVRPYAFAGIGYLGYTINDVYYDLIPYYSSYTSYMYYSGLTMSKTNKGSFGFDGGLGLDFRVSHNISLQAEAGIMMGVDDNHILSMKGNIGICYTF